MKARPRRNARDPQPPIGLTRMFAMIRNDDETAAGPPWRAANAWPLAKRIIDGTDDRPFQEAVDAMHPDLRAMLDGEPIAEADAVSAGFYVGFAACYLLIREVFSGDAS